MNRVVRRSLAAGAVALVCACTSDRGNPLAGPAQPLMEIRDGRNGGNEHFFFLAPIRPLHLAPPHTAPFNPNLSPVIDICVLTAGTCSAQVAHLTMSTGGLFDRVFVSRHFEEYTALWRTDKLNLDPRKTYRIRVLVGTRELGFADVDVVRTFREAVRVDRDEFVPLLEDLILPIRFRIQEGALCDTGDCNSASIDLSEGGFVVLENTTDRVDIPAQASGQVVTVTIELCDNIDVDLPVFGNCLRITADPPLEAPLFPLATVSICSIEPPSLPLTHEQSELLTVHRQDDDVVVALPHSRDACEGSIGRRDDAPSNLASLGWRAVRDVASWIFKPQTLHATTMVLDVGAGGQTDGFSDFQLALPAKMDIVSLADQEADANSPVASVPEVVVTDATGQPVANARVHFQITSTGGGSITPAVVLSNSDGHAALTQWTVGAAGRHIVQASGRGIADPKNNGPADGFDPFAPAIFHDPEEDEAQAPVTLGTGTIAFLATAVTGGFTPQTVLTGLEYPKGLWISHFDAYLTETAGHNTAFGGKNTLLHWTPDGGILQTLLTNPVNSDAVVVTNDGSIYLAGYVGSSPGEQGRVSRAAFTGAAGWVETPVTEVAIAAQDMFLDVNEDIYLIGPSDAQDATNIYRLPSGSYDSPVGLVTGLGRTWSLVKVGSTIYHSLITSGEVWGLSDVGNELLLTNTSAVTSLTWDGTFLYYGDIGGTIRRRNLSTGADELVTTGPGAINAVRYDPSSGRLYYLRSGTVANQYKDGTLNYITVNTPLP